MKHETLVFGRASGSWGYRKMRAVEIQAKSILSKSKVYRWTINPYRGCQHGCSYCYARFMKRFTHHEESWGNFVDAKVNAPGLLAEEVKKKKVGRVWISGVCDPYQPAEKECELTRRCLEVLQRNGWPVTIQTKSPLVLRDLDLLKDFTEIEVIFSIGTGDEELRSIFEPKAPRIEERINALRILYREEVRTHVMIAPMLPKTESLPSQLEGKVDHVVIDKMNYHYADWVYRKYGLERARMNEFFVQKGTELAHLFRMRGIPCQLLFRDPAESFPNPD